MRQAIAALFLLTLVASSGCATVIHHNVTDDAKDAGIRYLRTSPYLLAYSDGKGGIISEVHYLPDPQKKMSATPKATLSDVDLTMTFDRGVLTQTTEALDATAVPTAIAKAVEAFAPKLLGILNEAQKEQEHSLPPPYLFKIIVNDSAVRFVGGPGDTDIKITLLPQTTKEK
jgi:hypothetical protein